MNTLKITAVSMIAFLSVKSDLFAENTSQQKSPWNASTAITLGDAYWTRPGFFPTHKEGPVVQPEVNAMYDSDYGKVSGYVWLNQNLASGLSVNGMHELDVGINYRSPPLVKNERTHVGFFLHGAWWEYGIADRLGKSHPIIEPGIWFEKKMSEKSSLEAKASWVQLLGDKRSNGGMLDASISFPYHINKKITLAPIVAWMYLDGDGFYGSKEGTAHVRGILPFNYSFGKGYGATLGLRAQKGFNGKEDKIGGFLKLQKDF